MFSRFLRLIIFFVFIPIISAEEMIYITVGSDTLSALTENKILMSKPLKTGNGITLLRVPESQILKISSLMHEKFNRCGGFIYHPNHEIAQEAFVPQVVSKDNFQDYSIDQELVVNSVIKKVNPENIIETVKKLSNFKNRYYGNSYGVESQRWLKSYWETIIQNRPEARVELFGHEYSQPSVILTIQGTKSPQDIIVLGGHGDSINQSSDDQSDMNAPGADDNASGIATLTEILRVLIQEGYKPEKTIKIISYAAEEVGLRGSNEIARRMKSTKAKILGVIQFDMTNFPGPDGKINLISDHTNSNQNAFLGKLIDKYVQTPWSYGRCGYACSDHASWNGQGFAVSFPFETAMNGSNPHIHTNGDTLDKSKNSAQHAVKFAKLGISYIIELDR